MQIILETHVAYIDLPVEATWVNDADAERVSHHRGRCVETFDGCQVSWRESNGCDGSEGFVCVSGCSAFQVPFIVLC
jgi:hypothetical protein